MAGKDRGGAIKLFKHHDPHQLMRPGGGAESEPDLGPLDQAGRKTVGAADEKTRRRAIFRPPFAQQPGKRRTVQAIAALVENSQDRAIRYDVCERDRFLGAPALGVLCPAFTNFDDFDFA